MQCWTVMLATSCGRSGAEHFVHPLGFRRSAMSQHLDASHARTVLFLLQSACWLAVRPRPYKEIA